MKSTLPSKSLHRGSWASVVSASANSTTQSEVVVQSALDQTMLLQGCLARVESFLERAEAALSRLSLVPTTLLATQTPQPLGVAVVDSTEDRGAEPYGCFSPRVRENSLSMSAPSVVVPTAVGDSIAVLAAPVLRLMPELRDICSSPASPLSLERLEVDSSTTLCEGHVLPLSCEQLEAPKSIVSMVPVGEDDVLGGPRSDDVDAAGLLVPAPSRSPLVDDNYIKKYNEFYDFLDKWVADQSGPGITSGCLPKKKPNREKAKRNKSKKGGVIRKTPAIS